MLQRAASARVRGSKASKKKPYMLSRFAWPMSSSKPSSLMRSRPVEPERTESVSARALLIMAGSCRRRALMNQLEIWSSGHVSVLSFVQQSKSLAYSSGGRSGA